MPRNTAPVTTSAPNLTGVDPRLGPLADNGGPTQTMLPAAGSPVINAGTSNALATDQRGAPRTSGGGTDIGAVELQSNKFTFGKVKLKKKPGIAIVPVLLPSGGKITLKGSKTVKGQSKTAKKLATVSFQIRAKGKALKKLRKAGTVKVKLAFTFRPTGGIASSKNKTIRLAMKKKRRG